MHHMYIYIYIYICVCVCVCVCVCICIYIQVWNTKWGNCVATLKGHSASVNGCCFSHDGDT